MKMDGRRGTPAAMDLRPKLNEIHFFLPPEAFPFTVCTARLIFCEEATLFTLGIATLNFNVFDPDTSKL
jgi:hypothetical protein